MQILLILFGSISWILTMFKSGLRYPFGLGFWGANGHDGIWHLAVIENLIKGNFTNPVFSGEYLKNYHLGFDLLVALISKITSISTLTLYFQVLPIIFSFTIGFLTYKFVYLWTKSAKKALWSLFFVYFGGGFGWFVDFIKNKTIGGESMFWSQQAISSLINPPFALSLIFILSGLIFLIKFCQNKKAVNFIFTGIFFGFLIQIKAYAGVLVFISLGVLAFIKILKDKDFGILKIFLFSLLISLLIFLPLNKGAESMFVFKPFWYLETMVGFSDRFSFPRLYNAILATKGTFSVKAIVSIGLAFFIFILGNFGTRIIGFLEFFKKKDKNEIDIFIVLITIGLSGIIIPQFFVQKGTPWNTIQFFYYSLFVFSIFAGLSIGGLVKNKIVNNIFSIVIVFLTIPTTVGSLIYYYLPTRPPAKLSNYEIEALRFLSNKDEGIVLTYPYDQHKAQEAQSNPPRPLYLYESTAYVSAFSKHQVFLEDQVNLDITGFDWPKRRSEILNFYSSLDEDKVKEFLSENDIKYIYWVKPQRAVLGEKQLGLERIFENEEVDIYQVIR